jgi:predicted anti-sigma-YlaC factor YlaD
MSECDEVLALILEYDANQEARLRRHAARCSDCREQLDADRALRQTFQGIARPGPSLHFNRALGERLRAERQGLRRRRWRLLVMQGYWVAAIAASVIVMMLIRWPKELPSAPIAISLAAAFGITLIAPLVLFLCLRITPLTLILNTMETFRR